MGMALALNNLQKVDMPLNKETKIGMECSQGNPYYLHDLMMMWSVGAIYRF